MPRENEFNTLFGAEIAKKMKGREVTPYGVPTVQMLPSGILSLDLALGGGLPIGRVTEISGHPYAGKTTVALLVALSVIQRGGRVAWFEGEEALDPDWMVSLGIPAEEIYLGESDSLVDTHFHVYHPKYLEEGLENIRILCKSDAYDLFVYDSIGGSPTLNAYEADMANAQMAQHARVLGRFCAVMPQDMRQSKAAFIFLNQVYQNISNKIIDPLMPFGGTVIAKGGQGIAFLSTIRIMMYMPKQVKTNDAEIIGKKMTGRVYKNKVMWKGMLDFSYSLIFDPSYYFDSLQDILDSGLYLKILEKRGAAIYFEGANIGQGEVKFKNHLREDMELTTRLVDGIRNGIYEFRSKKGIVNAQPNNDQGEPETSATPALSQDSPDQVF